MASSLIAHYNFNDNDTTLVHDFSGNERHSTAETGLTISTDAGAVGKVGVFNGTTTEVNFGNLTVFDNLTSFSWVCKFKINTLPASSGYIFRRAFCFDLFVTNAGDVGIYVYDTAVAGGFMVHAAGLTTGEWYTLVMTWDNENIKYYRDSIDVRDTEGAAFATMHNPTSNFYIGSAGATNYFDGKIEMCSFYSKVLTTDEINAVMETPTGIRYEAGDGMIQTGDLIYNNNGSKEVCTWSEEFDEMEFSDNEQQLFADGELQIFKN